MLRTTPENVYNLQVDETPEYYANGILVHNCAFTSDFDRKKNDSPDRMDALVWALTELAIDPGAGTNILEFYRVQASEVPAAPKAEFGFSLAAMTSPSPTAGIRLRCPAGVSQVYGITGASYVVGADGTITVSDEDAKPLHGQGFVEIKAAAQ
jgi:hypothetical protein